MPYKINPKLLEEWKKEGELLTIFRCPRCFKKIPFYKTNNKLIDSIYLLWVREHKYCPKCIIIIKKKVPHPNPNNEDLLNLRIVKIIRKYEPEKEPINEELIYA